MYIYFKSCRVPCIQSCCQEPFSTEWIYRLNVSEFHFYWTAMLYQIAIEYYYKEKVVDLYIFLNINETIYENPVTMSLTKTVIKINLLHKQIDLK